MKKVFTCIKLYLLAYCLAFAGKVAGQTLITGNVLDEKNKPFPFANVLLLNAQDSALVKGMLSGESGVYRFENIKPGAYLVSISAVGYKQAYSKAFSVEASKSAVQVNTLVLEGSNKELKEVAVVAAKPLFEQHLDRLVVNVQNSITAAGSTALDVLERSPGVSVNRQNNTLAMSGKEGVVVMVNGKLSRLPTEAVMQMLSSMDAGNIQKIELISNPSARYDAEGNAGIINIVLVKNTDLGTNGSYSGNIGYGWYEKAGTSANLNHRTAKLNLFTDGSFSYDKSMFMVESDRKVLKQGQLIESSTISKRYADRHIFNARIGFDYLLGARTTLGGQVSGFNNYWEQYCKNNANIRHDKEIVTQIFTQDHEINHWRNIMGNLNLRHAFLGNQEINIDLDYLYFHHNNPHWYVNDYEYFNDNAPEQEHLYNTKSTPITMGVGKADYVKQISKDTKLETGVKGTLSLLKNNVVLNRFENNTPQPDPDFSQHVELHENIGAAYVNFQHQLSTSTKLQTGLRWESTYTNLTNLSDGENLIKRQYNNFFPSAFISQELNKHHDLQFSYSRRITRPTFNDLAPIFNFWDPYTFIFGNPALKPTFTNAWGTTYQLRKKYLLSFQYSHDFNAIAIIAKVDPEKNIQITTKENIRSSDTYSFNLTIPVTVTRWWQMQNNLMVNWQQNKTKYQGEPINISGRYGRLNATNNFTLPNDYAVEIAYLYQTRSLHGIGYSKAVGFLNIGIQKKLKNDNGILRLTGTDLLWTLQNSIVNKNPALNLDVSVVIRREPRVFRLTYTRNFGNKSLKAIKRRSTGSEEERQRVTN